MIVEVDDHPNFAKTLEALRSMSDEELIRQHDTITGPGTGRVVEPSYYLDELARREAKRQEDRMERMTRVIVALTAVNLALVAVSVAVVLAR